MSVTRIEKQRAVADKVLNMMYSIDPYAIVAGGAPRDWYFGKEATDIDLFFYCPQAAEMETMYKMLEHVGFDKINTKTGDNIPEWYKKNPKLHTVYEVVVDGEIVQMMRMSDSTFHSVVDYFPLSICKVWYKGGKLVLEKDFKRSVKFSAIYKTSEIYNNEHHYIKKILAKFPEYEYYNNVNSLITELIDV